MNLALFDVDTLARAVMRAVRDGDAAAVGRLLDTAVPRLWRYQERGAWMTDSMHDAGGPADRAIPPDDGARQARQPV